MPALKKHMCAGYRISNECYGRCKIHLVGIRQGNKFLRSLSQDMSYSISK